MAVMLWKKKADQWIQPSCGNRVQVTPNLTLMECYCTVDATCLSVHPQTEDLFAFLA